MEFCPLLSLCAEQSSWPKDSVKWYLSLSAFIKWTVP